MKQYFAPWERAFDRVVDPFQKFIHDESASGLLLMAATLVALVLANSPLHEPFHHLLEIDIGIAIGGWHLEHSLHHWINHGLMTLFFFVVGLEIKREVLGGELADLKAAALPLVAAVGGMVVPALLYAAATWGTPGIDGWGVPMATDIAFAVGILVLLGNRVPPTVMTFLVALAIVDDLGAVLVIALFYTDQLVWEALLVAAVLLGLLAAFNRFGIRRPLPYFVVGTLLWMAMLESGVHATLAGVLTAMTIPSRHKFSGDRFSAQVRRLMDEFDEASQGHTGQFHNRRQKALLGSLKRGVQLYESPLVRLENSLHVPVAFIIIPLFALANAGIPIPLDTLGAALGHPVTIGVMAGLVIGKTVGIAGLSWLAVKLGIGQLPTGMRTAHLIGIGLLGGVGFTMSIFIAELGFAQAPDDLLMAKTGILLASLVAGVAGYLWLRLRAN